MLKLTIAVPFYNTVKYLPKCIESLLNQDLPADEYEILLVDDGSTDGSLGVAQHYAAQHHHIRVISQPNRGSSAARNICIKEARGVYFRFVDSDDYIPQNNLRQFIEQMEREQLDMLRFNYHFVDEQYNILPKPASAAHINYADGIMSGEEFLVNRLGYACYACPFIFRHSVISNILFCEGDYFDDPEWTPRVCQQAQRVNSTNTQGYFYFQRANSLVRNPDLAAIERKDHGRRFLIEELLRQQAAGSSLITPWYQGMIAHTTVTLLNSVAIYHHQHAADTITFLRKNHLIPLSIYQAEPKTARKIKFINLSPRLYCWLQHLKHSTR